MYPIDYKQSFAVYSITLFCISYSASFLYMNVIDP